MRHRFRHAERVVSWLDSARSPAEAAVNVLVFIHAFPMNAEMWEAQIAAPPAGWRYLAPDLAGFGNSDVAPVPPPAGRDLRAADGAHEAPGLSLDDYARDILALLDHLGTERAVVAGLSMGGYTAFALLRLAPARVQGLVLANTKAEADSGEARKGRADMIGLLEKGGVGAVAEQMLPRLLSDPTRRTRPDVARRVRAIAEANSVEGVRQALVRMMNRPDSTSLLHAIRCPTLIVASDHDAVTPLDQAHAMQGAIAGAELAVVGAAGHLSNLEQPDQFNQAVGRFAATRFGG